MATTNITIRIDENLKAELQELVNELGMDMTTFFVMSAKQAVRDQAMPFKPSLRSAEGAVNVKAPEYPIYPIGEYTGPDLSVLLDGFEPKKQATESKETETSTYEYKAPDTSAYKERIKEATEKVKKAKAEAPPVDITAIGVEESWLKEMSEDELYEEFLKINGML